MIGGNGEGDNAISRTCSSTSPPSRGESAGNSKSIEKVPVELAATGKSSAEKLEKLTSLGHRLVARNAVDAILLAGTDLTLLFTESNTDFPHLDCAALHLREILREVTKP